MVFKKTASRLKEHFQERIRPYMPAPHEPLWKRVLAWTIFWGALGILVVAVIAVLTIGIFSIGLPDVRDLDKLAGVESTLIMDRDGGILYTIHGEENRQYVPLSDISENLQHATVAIEDDQFYSHIGFDVPGLAKAALHEFLGIGARRGGSTITQQLSKNAFLSTERSYIRKIRELILAIRLEHAYSKDKILELYLNRIPYGNNAYGAELASQIYFSKPAKDLTLAEAAVLASLPQAPSYYSPYGQHGTTTLTREFSDEEVASRNIKSINDLADSEFMTGLLGKTVTIGDNHEIYLPGRADLVLARMESLGYITDAQKKEAAAEIGNIEFKPYRTNIRAPHFVFYVRQLLEEKYGKEAVESGGLKVTTTIDPELQTFAEETVAKQSESNAKLYNSNNAALLGVDTKTGEILTMVGSADYFNKDIDGNVNMVTAYRQPGSSFKPFVYAKAFLNGYGPATVLYDVRTHFGGGYTPNNFDGTFQGPMPIRRALGQSRNIPAIKAYFLAGQEDEIISFVEKLGITGLREKKPRGGYGPSLGIGSGEVRMFDMVQGYLVFANQGVKKDPVAILKVEDREGKVLEEWKPEQVRGTDVLDPQVAYLITDILSDQSVNFGSLMGVPGHDVAAKTGTSNKKLPNGTIAANNSWMFGYTPQITLGVWSGNSDGSALKGNASGYAASGTIFDTVMTEYLKDKPFEPWVAPQGIKQASVSKASGKLPTALVPAPYITHEIFSSFGIPAEHDDVFVEKDVNTIDGLLPNKDTPERYVEKKLFMNHHDPINTYPSWQAGIDGWAQEMKDKDPNFLGLPPTQASPLFSAGDLAKEPQVFINSPAAGVIVPRGKLSVSFGYDAPFGFARVEIGLDGRALSTRDMPTKDGQIFITKVIKDGQHSLFVRVYDKKGYFGEASIDIGVSDTAKPVEPAPAEAPPAEGASP